MSKSNGQSACTLISPPHRLTWLAKPTDIYLDASNWLFLKHATLMTSLWLVVTCTWRCNLVPRVLSLPRRERTLRTRLTSVSHCCLLSFHSLSIPRNKTPFSEVSWSMTTRELYVITWSRDNTCISSNSWSSQYNFSAIIYSFSLFALCTNIVRRMFCRSLFHVIMKRNEVWKLKKRSKIAKAKETHS